MQLDLITVAGQQASQPVPEVAADLSASSCHMKDLKRLSV